MKKKILFIVVIATFIVAGISTTTEAIALPSDECLNGCYTTVGHCWCYQYYPNKEAPVQE
ncbi:MAG: hypothetical protein PF487_12375 [Bacteroidales bacterium]|jgi:hypothetical protein|nr:hypothetical protein [Bacteroidales bacterium]